MIKINLLPEEMRKIERVRKVKLNIALFSGSAIALGVVVVLVASFIIGRRMNQISHMKARLRELSAQRDEADAILKTKQQLTKEIEMLDGYSGGRILWSRRLNEVSDAVPDDLFLTKLNYTTQPAATLVIKGEALPGQGNRRVVEFIDGLRGDASFINEFPQLNYSIESIEGGRKLFEVTCARAKKS